MFWKGQICSGKVVYVLERLGMCRKGSDMFRKVQVCLGKGRCVSERSGMFRKGQVCLGNDRYV